MRPCSSFSPSSSMRGSSAPWRSTSCVMSRTKSRRRAVFSMSMQFHVLVIYRKVVDAAIGRGDPAGDLARFHHPLHQGLHERAVCGGGDPAVQAFLIDIFFNEGTFRIHELPRPCPD